MSKFKPRGEASVLVPIVGPTLTLLIQEPRKPKPIIWKPVSETFEPGENVLDAVVRGLKQEAGFDDLQFQVGADGHVAQITDPSVELVQIAPPKTLPNGHERHFWGIHTSDEVVRLLAGKTLHTPEGELIYTAARRNEELDSLAMFADHKYMVKKMTSSRVA